jgi:hypothetical protein
MGSYVGIRLLIEINGFAFSVSLSLPLTKSYPAAGGQNWRPILANRA